VFAGQLAGRHFPVTDACGGDIHDPRNFAKFLTSLSNARARARRAANCFDFPFGLMTTMMTHFVQSEVNYSKLNSTSEVRAMLPIWRREVLRSISRLSKAVVFENHRVGESGGRCDLSIGAGDTWDW